MKARHQTVALAFICLAAPALAEDVVVHGALPAEPATWRFDFQGLTAGDYHPVPPVAPRPSLSDQEFGSRFPNASPYARALGGAASVSSIRRFGAPGDLGAADQAGSGARIGIGTPRWYGVLGHLGLVSSGPDDAAAPDAWELSATFDDEGLFLGAGYRFQPEDGVDWWGVGGAYDLGSMRFSAAFQRSDDPRIFGRPNELRPYAGALGLPAKIAFDSGDGTIVDFAFQYRFGQSRARLGYERMTGSARVSGSALDLELDRWVVGIDHGLAPSLDLFAEYQYSDRFWNDEPMADDAFGLGLRHRF